MAGGIRSFTGINGSFTPPFLLHVTFSQALKAFSTFYSCVVEDGVYSGCGSSFVEPGATDISSGGVFHKGFLFPCNPPPIDNVHAHGTCTCIESRRQHKVA